MPTSKVGRLYASEVLKALGVENPVWDQHGAYVLIMEDGLAFSITVDPGSDVITLRSPMNGPVEHRVFLERLLQANFLWRGTQRAVFVIENNKPVLLLRVHPQHVSGQRFRELAESFLNAAANWDAASRQAWETGPADAEETTVNHIRV